jgi:hypothetical protein
MKPAFEVALGLEAPQLVNDVKSALKRLLAWHYRKQHRIVLIVDDYGRRIECLFCGGPLVQGSDDVIDGVLQFMKEADMTFEVYCRTVLTNPEKPCQHEE